jgi:hypothetical protein
MHSKTNLNWLVFGGVARLPGMTPPAESSFSAAALESFLSAQPRRVFQRRRELAPAKPSKKHSLIAGVFLVAYLAVYLAVGFVAISVIQRVWLTIAP